MYVSKNTECAFELDICAEGHTFIACVQCVGNVYNITPCQRFSIHLGVRACKNAQRTHVFPENDCNHFKDGNDTMVYPNEQLKLTPSIVVHHVCGGMQLARCLGRCAFAKLCCEASL